MNVVPIVNPQTGGSHPIKPVSADDSIFDQILKDTYTKQQLFRRFRLIKDFTSFILFDQPAGKGFNESILSFFIDQKSIKPEYVSAETSWLQTLGEGFFKQFGPQNIHERLKVLEKRIEGQATIIIHLPIELPEESLKEIGVWLKGNVDPYALFEVNFNADLIAGCALSYKGIYKDFSIKAQLEDNRKLILDSLASFKR